MVHSAFVRVFRGVFQVPFYSPIVQLRMEFLQRRRK
jgi:hypothetical protein